MLSLLSFHFTSPQFSFNSGHIVFFKGARLSSDGEMPVGEIRDGSISGVLVEGPLEFDAMLQQLSVIRRDDNRGYAIGRLWVSYAMTAEDIRSGRVVVDLDLPIVIVVRVEDTSGNPVPGAIINFSLPSREPTTEGPVNDRGELVLFGTPGYYSFRLAAVGDRWLGRERVFEEFDVGPDDRGERTIVLRVPNP